MAATYREGHVKRDPETGTVAVRTVFTDDEPALANQLWLTATTNRGAHFATTGEVEGWEDIFVPPAELEPAP